MYEAVTLYVPASTFSIVYFPSPSVAAPFVVPSTITLAPASGCPSDDVTTPLSLPAVCENANFSHD